MADMRKAGLEPLEPYTTVMTPWLCRCMKCGKEVTPKLNGIRSGQGGCRYCGYVKKCLALRGSKTGAVPAIVYVITHKGHGAHKIGITGKETKKDRLEHHRRKGWQVFRTAQFDVGYQAHWVEQSVLRRLREEWGLGPYLSAGEMPQGGWGETVDAESISLPELWRLVEEAAKVKAA